MKGLLSFALGISLFFIGCSNKSQKKEEIKVGILQPLTGPIANFGQKTLDGIKVVYEKYNTLPDGKKIKLVIVDNQFDKVQNVNGYQRLVSKDNVIAIEGPLASSMAKSIKRFAEKSKTPTITQIATNPDVTKNTKYVTRTCFTDDFQGKVAANYALKHNYNTAVVLFDSAQDYSIGLEKEFVKNYEKKGKILALLHINTGDKDFSAQIAQIKKLNPKFIYAPIYAPEGGLFVKQLRAAGVKAVVMGGDGLADVSLMRKLAGEAAEGVLFTDHFDYHKPPTKLSKEFIQKFEEKYHRKPSAFAATGADGYILIFNAIKECNAKNDLTKECVNTNIREAKNIEAVTGDITIDPKTGNPIDKPAVVKEIEGNKAVFEELVR